MATRSPRSRHGSSPSPCGSIPRRGHGCELGAKKGQGRHARGSQRLLRTSLSPWPTSLPRMHWSWPGRHDPLGAAPEESLLKCLTGLREPTPPEPPWFTSGGSQPWRAGPLATWGLLLPPNPPGLLRGDRSPGAPGRSLRGGCYSPRTPLVYFGGIAALTDPAFFFLHS